MKRSPLFPLLLAQGATPAVSAEWEIASRIGPPDDEYAALRHGAGLLDLSHRTLLRVTGHDRIKFLQGILSNDATLLAPGRGLYATILTPKGKMLADLTVEGLAESLWVDSEPELAEKLPQLLNRYKIGSDAKIVGLTGQWGLLGLYGPRASAVLASAAPGLDVTQPPLGVREWSWRTQSIVVAEAGYPGTPGYRILAPTDTLEPLWRTLLDAGARPVGQDALDVIRTEAGVPRYGSDMGEENFPPEARIEDRAISYTKGCYVGQETIARIKTYGHVNRLLVGLLPETDQPLPPGVKLYHPDVTSVLRENKEAGYVTSSIRSPALKRVIALGYLHHTVTTPGTTVAVGTDPPIAATVVALPFTAAG